MHHEHWTFVRQYLLDHGGEQSQRAGQQFRTRSSHIRRVCMWVERLMENDGADDPEALRLAAVFHDVGYDGEQGGEDHAARSADVLRAYAAEHGLDTAMVERAVFLVAEHSSKQHWLHLPEASRDLVLLMEADLLDEEGAMGLALDCLTAAMLRRGSYETAWAQMLRHEPKRLAENPMVTPTARAFWAEKQRIIREFMDAFAADMGIEGIWELPDDA